MPSPIIVAGSLLALSFASPTTEGSTPEKEADTFVFLRAPLPVSTPKSCGTVPVNDRLVRASLSSPGSGACPVATVGGGAITVEDLLDMLAPSHAARKDAAKKGAGMDFAPVLERIIEARLITLEAREMGLGETPEAKAQMTELEASTQRKMLQDRVTAGVRAEALEVERIYRNKVITWKVKSLLLPQESDAEAFRAQLVAGKDFDKAAAEAVAAKTATGPASSETIAARSALPQVSKALVDAKPGSPLAPIRVPGGFAVMVLVETVYPDDPVAKAEAQAESLNRQRGEAVRRYFESLVKKYAKVDRALLKKLDWEARKPGIASLERDKRVLVTIQGEAPIRVADLTRAIEDKFFHGMEGPIKEHRVNLEKMNAFETLLGARLFAKEARVLKLSDDPGYIRAIEEQKRAILFSSFVEKVILPDVKVTEEEGVRYFKAHQSEFTSPQMYKLDGIAFSSVRAAQDAMRKLAGGADLSWMRTNADGRLGPQAQGSLSAATVVSANTLPAGLAKALTGARAGDYRLYEASPAEVDVIRVVEQIPPAVLPYESAREEIGKKLFSEKLLAAIREYAAKVRQARPVDVIVERIGS
jgi:hypothetical protein